MADPVVAIGSLRWPVLVARRRQQFDKPGKTSIYEDWIQVQMVRAEIMPVNAVTFYVTGVGGGDEQVDTPVTHRITTRWLGYLDNSYVIIRETALASKDVRGEIFRIRRVKELNGRKRFTSLDCELERVIMGPVPQP